MPWPNTPENFFPRYGAAHGHAQEPTPGSAVEFLGESVCKNRPLVPRSNIAGSWAGGGVCIFYRRLAEAFTILTLFGGVPCAVRVLCEKLAVLHHREFGKFRRLDGCH